MESILQRMILLVLMFASESFSKYYYLVESSGRCVTSDREYPVRLNESVSGHGGYVIGAEGSYVTSGQPGRTCYLYLTTHSPSVQIRVDVRENRLNDRWNADPDTLYIYDGVGASESDSESGELLGTVSIHTSLYTEFTSTGARMSFKFTFAGCRSSCSNNEIGFKLAYATGNYSRLPVVAIVGIVLGVLVVVVILVTVVALVVRSKRRRAGGGAHQGNFSNNGVMSSTDGAMVLNNMADTDTSPPAQQYRTQTATSEPSATHLPPVN